MFCLSLDRWITEKGCSNSLPAGLRANYECLKPGRLALIRCRATEPVTLMPSSLFGNYKNSPGSALGSDRIYPITSQLVLAGELVFLQFISICPGHLSVWARQPMVLNRLQWKLGLPHEYLHGFTRGMITAHTLKYDQHCHICGSIREKTFELISRESQVNSWPGFQPKVTYHSTCH